MQVATYVTLEWHISGWYLTYHAVVALMWIDQTRATAMFEAKIWIHEELIHMYVARQDWITNALKQKPLKLIVMNFTPHEAVATYVAIFSYNMCNSITVYTCSYCSYMLSRLQATDFCRHKYTITDLKTH